MYKEFVSELKIIIPGGHLQNAIKGIAIAYGLSIKSLQSYSIPKQRKTFGSFLHSTRSFSESTIDNFNFAEVT